MHFKRIDQLRGFAALAVVACHFAVSAYRGAPNAGEEPFPWLALVLGFGYLGVPLFFVISGFCIHLPQARARAASGTIVPEWGRFFRRRFWRLYPPYLCALAVALVLLWVATGGVPVGWPVIAAQAFLVQTFHPATFDGLNPPAWTLAVEAQLYLAYPIVFLLIARFEAWRALAIVLAMTMAYRFLLTFAPAPPPFGAVAWEVFVARWFEWVLGAAIAEWAVGAARLPRLARSPLSAALVLALAVGLEWEAWRFGVYAFKEPLYGIAFALVLIVALDRERARPGGVAATPIGGYLAGVGVYSYSLYLLHRPIQLAFEPLARAIAARPFVIDHRIPSSLLLMASTTPLVLWASRLFYRLVEEPCVRFAQQVGRRPAEPAPAAVAVRSR